MNYRRYLISIDPRNHHSLPDGLLRQFGCSVTEPSNWITERQTLERGLTFLDHDGHELNSEIFVHLPTFPRTATKSKEKLEIKAHICDRIRECYHIEPSDLLIHIMEF